MNAAQAPRCPCGWAKPLFEVTTRSGDPPREDLVLSVRCPECGQRYSPSERDRETVRRLLSERPS